MDIDALLEYLGCPLSDQQLLSFLRGEGMAVPVGFAPAEGEYRAYIERPREGYSLVFTDEAFFEGKDHQPLGVGQMIFSGIFLYSEGKDGYSQFKESLPMNLSFSSERAGLIKNLGPPSWERKRADNSIAAERWDDVANYRIHITYAKLTDRPLLISLSRPDAQ